MKFLEKKWDLFKYWLSEYFKHPVDNIRQADPIVPGKLYRSFGHLVKAVRLTEKEQDLILWQRNMEELGLREQEMLTMASKAEITTAKLRLLSDTWGTPCQFCGLYGVTPCPAINRLKNGENLCDTHKYVMIRKAKAI